MLRGRFGGFWETLIEDDGGVGVGDDKQQSTLSARPPALVGRHQQQIMTAEQAWLEG